MHSTRRIPRLRTSAALAATVLAVLAGGIPTAAQAVPVPPQLSIAVDDGRDSAAPADELSYALTVTNLGTKPVKDLIITQTVPAGAALESTDPESAKPAPTVTWKVDVEPGKTATLKTTMTVAKSLPDGLLRLATVTCARTSAKAPPLVCASDSDQLPAGAVADEQRRELEQPAAGSDWWPLPGAIVLGGLVLALLIVGLLLIRRRNGRHPGGPVPDTHDPANLVSSSRL